MNKMNIRLHIPDVDSYVAQEWLHGMEPDGEVPELSQEDFISLWLLSRHLSFDVPPSYLFGPRAFPLVYQAAAAVVGKLNSGETATDEIDYLKRVVEGAAQAGDDERSIGVRAAMARVSQILTDASNEFAIDSYEIAGDPWSRFWVVPTLM